MITTSNGNQYLRPDYLTPLPTTLDSKKSPLALLAQTCSQIGADTTTTISGSNSSNIMGKPLSLTTDKSGMGKREQGSGREKASPAASSSSSSGGSSSSPIQQTKSGFKPYESDEKPINGSRSKTPGKKEIPLQTPLQGGSPRASPSRKTPQAGGVIERSVSPVKTPLAPYLYPELLRNPYLAAYPRLKAGSECRDPYCAAGCHLLAGGKTCPAGCTQCEKAGLHYAQLAALAAASAAQPYLCSWIGADAAYCGKRFSTSDDLLSHLRTHTGDFPPGAASHPLLHRAAYPNPPLSPLATPRYHPYSKPPILPSSLPPPPFPLPPHPGLSPYLSPYSFYGPRLGASHP